MRFPNLYKFLIRPLVFRMDAEKAHNIMVTLGSKLWRWAIGRWLTQTVYVRKHPLLRTNVCGIEFRNPIGLAAGFDKDAALLFGIDRIGFGFIEVGTVTPRPQQGNPKPRLQRLPEQNALLNRMGFNNAGAEAMLANLKQAKSHLRVPIGINLGKNKDTPNTAAIKDYEILLKKLSDYAHYFVINISSPNTPGLRDLQNIDFIHALGERVMHLRLAQPVFIKLSPEIEHDDFKAICKTCGSERSSNTPFSGLILTNTIPTDLGGISGQPLKGPSTQMLKMARAMLDQNVPVISVGGISTADDIEDRLKIGASAVQIYSSLVYEGPGHVKKLLKDLSRNKKTISKR